MSESETAFPTKTPVDPATWRHDAGDVATELLFQGWTPGHELEAEPIVDHGETPGGQGHTLAVDAGDMVALT